MVFLQPQHLKPKRLVLLLRLFLTQRLLQWLYGDLRLPKQLPRLPIPPTLLLRQALQALPPTAALLLLLFVNLRLLQLWFGFLVPKQLPHPTQPLSSIPFHGFG